MRKLEEISSSINIKARRATEINEEVKAWLYGKSTVQIAEAIQKISMLCVYVEDLTFLATVLNEEVKGGSKDSNNKG